MNLLKPSVKGLKKQLSQQQSRTQRKAFTLVEMLVVVTIVSFISIGLTAFMTDAAKGMLWSTNKSKITKDVRLFTIRISQETLGANVAYVYTSFSPNDCNQYDDRRVSGQSGDCLVLVYTEPHPDISDPKHYERLIVYYRDPDPNDFSSVYRCEVEFATPQEIKTENGIDHFEKFLASHLSLNSDAQTVLELSKGLSDGSLFRSAINGTFVINGEIIHGQTNNQMTNTYNLTISPRG